MYGQTSLCEGRQFWGETLGENWWGRKGFGEEGRALQGGEPPRTLKGSLLPALILKVRGPGMEGQGHCVQEQGPSACPSEGWAGLRAGKQGLSVSKETQPGLTSLWPLSFSPQQGPCPAPATSVERRAEQIEWCCVTSHKALCLFGPQFPHP